jgi:hypothetical protein
MTLPSPVRSFDGHQLPDSWAVERVGKLFDIQQGKQVSKANRVGGNQRPFLRTKDVQWDRIDLSELDEMHFTAAEERRLALLQGDLLLCEGGSVGRTALWPGNIDHCYYQNHLHRLRVVHGATDPRYALYWFWYAFEFGSAYSGRKNVTTIPNLSQSRLGDLPVVVPPFDEQRRIAALLSAVQQAIEQQEKLIALAAELKKALMHKLFTEGRKDPVDYLTDRYAWASQEVVHERLESHLIPVAELANGGYERLDDLEKADKIRSDFDGFLRRRAELVSRALELLVEGRQLSAREICAD